jgi:hypothetical protein
MIGVRWILTRDSQARFMERAIRTDDSGIIWQSERHANIATYLRRGRYWQLDCEPRSIIERCDEKVHKPFVRFVQAANARGSRCEQFVVAIGSTRHGIRTRLRGVASSATMKSPKRFWTTFSTLRKVGLVLGKGTQTVFGRGSADSALERLGRGRARRRGRKRRLPPPADFRTGRAASNQRS